MKKLEQYKEEIQELMEKHEKMQKQNSQLRNDLMLLKEKRFSPEDRYVPPSCASTARSFDELALDYGAGWCVAHKMQ